MDLLKALQWRYAVKKFDPSKEVDQKLVDKIIEAAWLAPTSSGLQPFQIIDITNHDLKNKIVPIAFDQLQVAGCSPHGIIIQPSGSIISIITSRPSAGRSRIAINRIPTG